MLYHVRLIDINKKIRFPCRDVAVLRLYIICNKPVMILLVGKKKLRFKNLSFYIMSGKSYIL
jgi:hypothetical protein